MDFQDVTRTLPPTAVFDSVEQHLAARELKAATSLQSITKNESPRDGDVGPKNHSRIVGIVASFYMV